MKKCFIAVVPTYCLPWREGANSFWTFCLWAFGILSSLDPCWAWSQPVTLFTFAPHPLPLPLLPFLLMYHHAVCWQDMYMWHSISTCHCTFFSQCPGRMLSNHSLGNELEAVPIPNISFFIQLLSCKQSSMNVPNNPQSWLHLGALGYTRELPYVVYCFGMCRPTGSFPHPLSRVKQQAGYRVMDWPAFVMLFHDGSDCQYKSFAVTYLSWYFCCAWYSLWIVISLSYDWGLYPCSNAQSSLGFFFIWVSHDE